MRILIVEDDLVSRKMLSAILHPYGQCDVAVDGEEALALFDMAWKEGDPYTLICLDIMMPKLDGQTVLKRIRTFEKDKGIMGLDGVKIIMTTALDDRKNIMEAFKSQCEAYMTKPIDKGKLIAELRSMDLIADN